ncbi:MAG: hypothetical protein GY745_10420 [Actinomycetia bacterium]|nr:hypothetical protein [Actinomycetes bacterium]
MIVTVDDDLRQQFARLSIVKTVAVILDDERFDDSSGYRRAMLSLPCRWRQLDNEAKALAGALSDVVEQSAPEGLLDEQGVGPDVAAALMIAETATRSWPFGGLCWSVALGRDHPPLPRQTHHRRQDETRSNPMPEACTAPRGPPGSDHPTPLIPEAPKY